MAPPLRVSPVEALRTVTRESPPPDPAAVPLDEARTGYVARKIESITPGGAFPGDAPGVRRARWDGYALGRPAALGEELEVLDLARSSEAGAAVEWRKGLALRVECGDRLDDEVFAVLPVERAVITGSGRARVEGPSEPGEGIAGGSRSGRPPAAEAGTPLSPRLRAFLLARGVQDVETYPPPRVGILAVGDELTDLRLAPGPGERSEVTGYWLAEALAGEGADAVPLGIVGGEPGAIRGEFLRNRGRRLDALIIAGGTGDGITDRTGEALRSMDSRLFFERVSLEGCPSFLFARSGGMDVFALSGAPLAAAAAYDLWVRPAILARLGAASWLWDWSRARWDLEARLDRPPRAGGWRLLAARRVAGSLDSNGRGARGRQRLRVWEPESPFSPWVAGADGWALAPPPEDAAAGVYYQSYGAR